MKSGIVAWASMVAPAMMALGCGGAPQASQAPSTPAAEATAGSALDGGASAPDSSAAPPPPEHPFAKSAIEATSLIDEAINGRVNELTRCVEEARMRRKSPHERLMVEIGIDQEGHLLGVELPKKEKRDKAFVDCVLAALQGAPFPKSHAGVITVRKIFEDKAVYK
ncbi:MAG TPA: hypothetical protein VGI39_20370 [Polyangiaceae bacterium]|jgi:hypothetical protein